MHSAVQDYKNANIVKYFLSQDACKPMLLSVWKRDTPPHGSFLPLDIVNDQVVRIIFAHTHCINLFVVDKSFCCSCSVQVRFHSDLLKNFSKIMLPNNHT